MSDSEFMTRAEVAIALHTNPPTVLNWERRGAIPQPIYYGNKPLYRRVEIEPIAKTGFRFPKLAK